MGLFPNPLDEPYEKKGQIDCIEMHSQMLKAVYMKGYRKSAQSLATTTLARYFD